MPDTLQAKVVQWQMRCVRAGCACGSTGPPEEFTLQEVRVRDLLTNGCESLFFNQGPELMSARLDIVVSLLTSALAVYGPRRMAVLLSTPMGHGRSKDKLSFLYMISQFDPLPRVRPAAAEIGAWPATVSNRGLHQQAHWHRYEHRACESGKT